MLKVGLVLAALQAVQVPPAPRGFGTSTAEVVVDAAGVLSPESTDRINRLAFDVHAKSGGELAVVTIPDIGDRRPYEVATQVGRTWGVGANAQIGASSRNAGAVILLVPKETSSDGRGHCFVAPGRGTEGFITDAESAAICREATPLFAQRDYSGGLEVVARRTAEKFAQEFGFTLDTTLAIAPPLGGPVYGPTTSQPRRGGISPFTMILIVFFVLWLFSRRGGGGGGRRRRRGGFYPVIIPPIGGGGFGSGGGWGSGGGGGGFGGFGGGGGFSGGGGGSDW